MTKETCTTLLAHYEAIGRKDAYEDLKQNILNGSKFSKDEKDALFKPKATPVTKAKEAK